MAYLFNRGTRDKPNLHGRYKDDGGAWKMIKVPAEHATSKKVAQLWIDDYEGKAQAPAEPAVPALTCGALMDRWIATVDNRNAADDARDLALHIRPFFADRTVTHIDHGAILDWLDLQRLTAKKKRKGSLSESSIRKHLTLLSRFLSWCVPRHISFNPVATLPSKKRPQSSRNAGNGPWIEDEKTVRDLFHALPEPYNLMFYVGNRSAMRLGEICGLRMESFDNLDRGTIFVRYTYDGGFLKEDKRCAGKSKLAPASEDLAAVLRPWLAKRRAEGATAASLVFPNAKNEDKAYQKGAVEKAWRKVCAALKLQKVHPDDGDVEPAKQRKVPRVTFYEATRHSFASRVMMETKGRALFEVSKALGHASVEITLRSYSRYVVTEFSPELRRGLGLGESKDAAIIPMTGVQ